MKSVLFVCTGNMYRSPIAAETFRVLLHRDGKQHEWQVGSAGTWTAEGRSAPEDALEAARALGLQLDGHRTRMINRDMMEENDLIMVMEENHLEALRAEFPFAEHKIHLLTKALNGFPYDIPDPARERGETRVILREMVNMIKSKHKKIYNLAA